MMIRWNDMRHRKHAWTLLFCIAPTILCMSCTRPISFDRMIARPDMRITNFTSSSYQDGKLSLEVSASESTYYFKEKRSFLMAVTIRTYKDGKQDALIRADRAMLDNATKNMELYGEVYVLSPSGSRLYTTQLDWNDQKKFIETDASVRIVKENGDIITGTGLRANYSLEDYELKKNVVAISSHSDVLIKKRNPTEKK